MANQNIYNPETGQTGFQTPGATLQPGWQWSVQAQPQPVSSEGKPNEANNSQIPASDDSKLLSMGLTPQQVQQLNTPQGLDDTSFKGVIDQVQNKLKENNTLVTQRQLLLKHLYDSPLTPEEQAKLDPMYQSYLNKGDINDVQLAVRTLNDQIAGRNNTVSQSVQALTTGYDKYQADIKNATTSILNYAQSTGKSIAEVAKALAPIYGVNLTDQMMRNLEALGVPLLKTNQVGGSTGNMIVTIGADTIASKTNNPLNIKYSPTSAAGGLDSGIPGQDGGTFAAFNSPQEGLQAAINLLESPTYADLTVDQAMKKWSNNGYGAEVSSAVDKSQKISSLSDDQMQQLVSDMAKRESGTTVSYPLTDIQAKAEGIINGTQPPDLSRLYGKSLAVSAELERRGFNLSKATQDWTAAMTWLKNLNSSQMVRFKTLGVSVVNTIDEVKRLASEMNLRNIKVANKAELEAYINATGAESENGKLASQYLAAANTLKEEFANLAQGGYAPTEAAWELANKQINENYDISKFNASLEEVQRLINYRLNAPAETQPTSLGGGTNQYASPTTPTTSSGSTYKGFKLPN